MEFNANRVDGANAVITATVTKETIETYLDKVAKEAAKTMNVQGFRKGKVPVAVVKQRYADKLREDAEADARDFCERKSAPENPFLRSV